MNFRTLSDSSTQDGDEDRLMQRLEAVMRIPDGVTTGFKRRRSSGLLFRIRRRIRLGEPPAAFTPSGHSPD